MPLPGCLGGWQEEEGGPWEGACPARWEAPAAISNLRSETGVAGVVRQPTPRPRPSNRFDQSALHHSRLARRRKLGNDPPSLYDHCVSTPTAAPDSGLQPRFTPNDQERFSDPERTVGVLHDLFPAEVSFRAATIPGATAADVVLAKCRVLIAPDAVYVFTDGPRGPILAFFDQTASFTGSLQTGFTLTPANPGLHQVQSLTAAPTGRCGCGSRLRSFRPFGRISYIPSPA